MSRAKTPPKPPVPPPDEERVRWLFDFLYRDLSALRPGERLDLIDDVARLLFWIDPAADLPSGMVLPAVAEGDGRIFDEALVVRLQATLLDGIDQLEAGWQWLPFAEDPLHPMYSVQADRTITRQYLGSAFATMLASAVDLLVTVWPRVLRCELATCRRLFVPDHGKQRFHNPQCANLARYHRPPDQRAAPTRRNYTQEKINRIKKRRKR